MIPLLFVVYMVIRPDAEGPALNEGKGVDVIHLTIEDFGATRARIGDEVVAGGGAVGTDLDGIGGEAGARIFNRSGDEEVWTVSVYGEGDGRR